MTSSVAQHSGTSPQIPESGTSPCNNLNSTKYYSGGESPPKGKTPNWRLRGAYAFAAAVLDSTDEEEEGVLPVEDGGDGETEKHSPSSETESSCVGEQSVSISPPLQLDSGESALILHIQMYIIQYHL